MPRFLAPLAVLFLPLLAAQPEAPPILWSAAVSPDGGLIATSGDPTRWIYNADTLEPDPSAANLPHAAANDVVFHPTKPLLAIAGWPDVTGLYDLASRTLTPLQTTEGARSIAFNHDGALVALAEHDGSLSVWTVATPPELIYRDRPDNAKSLTGVDWHPTRNTLVSVGELITIHDLTTDPPAKPVRFEHRPDADTFSLLLSIDWRPDADEFLISDYGATDTGLAPTIQLRAADGSLIWSIERPGAEIRNVRWSPDATRFAATSDALLIYSPDATLERVILPDAEDPANLWGLAWSPDGATIYATDQSGRAWQVDLATARAAPFAAE